MVLSKKNIFFIGSLLFISCLLFSILLQNKIFLLMPFAVIFSIATLYYYKLSWFLLLICIPISFEYNFTDSLGLDLPDEPLMLIITGIFILLFFLKSFTLQKKYLTNSIFYLITAAFIWSFISACFSNYTIISFKFVIAKLWFIIPFTIMPMFFLQQKKDFKIAALCLTISLFFTVCVVLIKQIYNGFLFEKVNDAVALFYRNHVTYAAILVCCIPIVVTIYFLSIDKKLKYILLPSIIIMLIAVFFSYSRGAWLALIVGFIAIFAIKYKLISFSFIGIILIFIISIIFLSQNNRYIKYHSNFNKTIYHSNFNDHINATFNGTDMSNAERINRWIAGIKMIGENKLTGFGPNTFYNNYKPYEVSYFKTWVSSNKEKSTVHNYFLLTFIEQGFIGFCILILLLFTCFSKIEKLYYSLNNPFNKNIILCIGVILSMIITLNMLSDLIETDKIGSLFYLCLGIIIIIDVKKNEEIIL